jgi:hypothetical protein
VQGRRKLCSIATSLNFHRTTRHHVKFIKVGLYVKTKLNFYIQVFSVVSTTTGYGLEDRGVGVPSPGRVKNFLFALSIPALRTTQPPIQWVPGPLSPGVKLPGREVDHSPPTSAEVKKIHALPHTPSWRSA